MTSPVAGSPLQVALEGREYPIHIARGLIDREALFAESIRGTHAAIVTNETVAPLYLERVSAAIERAGKRVVRVVLPDGEAHKDLATLERIYAALLGANADRKTTLVALGGGVIGDMAGFAAATYMRGMPFVQVPTTLLAQVDSSVGGKTAVNHPLGKNMIGAFHQPVAVIADLATLDTLPERELSAGLAEVIKHGAILDAAFFAWIEAAMPKLLARDPEALAHAVRRSCEIKAEIVRLDERESGVRALLNFGHTFGHAIETGLGYGEWLHGEAVAAGMVLAARVSTRLGWLAATDAARIAEAIRAARLPSRAPALGVDRYMALMAHDKKADAGAIVYVLLRKLGEAVAHRVPDATVREVLAAAEV